MTLQRLNPGSRMSQAVSIGDIVFLAGQVPDDLTGDITAQTRDVLDKVDAVMAELGGSKADIASVQVWLSDMADFQGMNAVNGSPTDQRSRRKSITKASVHQPSLPPQTRARSVDHRSFGFSASEGSASIRGRAPVGRLRACQPLIWKTR